MKAKAYLEEISLLLFLCFCFVIAVVLCIKRQSLKEKKMFIGQQ